MGCSRPGCTSHSDRALAALPPRAGAALVLHFVMEDEMPAKNPRISSVIDLGLWKWLRAKAAHEGISVSLVVRDLLMRARAEEEEQYWAVAGEERLESFSREGSLSHDDVWG